MGNLTDTKPINQLIIEMGGNEYVFAGGGGQPGPNTVGTEQIIDDAVEMEDLNPSVREKITNTYNKGNETLTLGSLNVTQAATQPTTPTQPMVVEEEEEP